MLLIFSFLEFEGKAGFGMYLVNDLKVLLYKVRNCLG